MDSPSFLPFVRSSVLLQTVFSSKRCSISIYDRGIDVYLLVVEDN